MLKISSKTLFYQENACKNSNRHSPCTENATTKQSQFRQQSHKRSRPCLLSHQTHAMWIGSQLYESYLAHNCGPHSARNGRELQNWESERDTMHIQARIWWGVKTTGSVFVCRSTDCGEFDSWKERSFVYLWRHRIRSVGKIYKIISQN